MTMGVQINIQLHAEDGQDHPELHERVSNVVMAGVIRGMEQVYRNTAAFDPVTGELLYNTPYPDEEAAHLLSHVQVASPQAVLNILAQIDQDDEVGSMDGAIIRPVWED
jgi:hypothetical protein